MLRHLLGLLAGIAVAPLLWAGVAWPASEIGSALGGGDALAAPMTATALGVLMLVGLACGFLAGARVSPLAAFVSGGALLAFCLWPVIDPGSLDAALPEWLGRDTLFHPAGPGLPIALPLGTLLFVSSVVPSRWSRRAAPMPPAHPAPYEGRPGPAADPYGDRAADPYGPPATYDDRYDDRPAPYDAPYGDADPRESTLPDTAPPAPRPGADPERTTTPFRRGPEGPEEAPWQDDRPRTRAFRRIPR
ncbi:hypothetical protein [Nocardiopsis trehalosi]|uniref:hypothetical protein n=1 Tax=Nocardiopsis trehalosi TaxID=109329 RepID=UPI00082AF1FF|nr:hypothetical protein [Nocardiopsis trehalosi]